MYELCRLRRSEGYGVCFDERAVAVQSFWRKALLSAKRKKKGSPEPFFFRSLLDLFLDLGGLAQTVTQIVQLCSANFTSPDDFNLVYNWRVQREDTFHTAAISNSSYSKGFVDAAVLLCDNGSFKNLDTALVAFLNSNVYLYGVADTKSRNFLLQAGIADHF